MKDEGGGMNQKHQYERVKCHLCGNEVSGNWYIRHVKSGCKSGLGSKPKYLKVRVFGLVAKQRRRPNWGLMPGGVMAGDAVGD